MPVCLEAFSALQPLAGSKHPDGFHQLLVPPPYSLFVASVSCASPPFASLFFGVSSPRFLFPLPRFSLSGSFCSRAAFWVNLRRCLFIITKVLLVKTFKEKKKKTRWCVSRGWLTRSLNACHHRSGVLAAFVLKCVVALRNRVKMIRCIWMILNSGFLVCTFNLKTRLCSTSCHLLSWDSFSHLSVKPSS